MANGLKVLFLKPFLFDNKLDKDSKTTLGLIEQFIHSVNNSSLIGILMPIHRYQTKLTLIAGFTHIIFVH